MARDFGSAPTWDELMRQAADELRLAADWIGRDHSVWGTHWGPLADGALAEARAHLARARALRQVEATRLARERRAV